MSSENSTSLDHEPSYWTATQLESVGQGRAKCEPRVVSQQGAELLCHSAESQMPCLYEPRVCSVVETLVIEEILAAIEMVSPKKSLQLQATTDHCVVISECLEIFKLLVVSDSVED